VTVCVEVKEPVFSLISLVFFILHYDSLIVNKIGHLYFTEVEGKEVEIQRDLPFMDKWCVHHMDLSKPISI
jgi:hypothetical protein